MEGGGGGGGVQNSFSRIAPINEYIGILFELLN